MPKIKLSIESRIDDAIVKHKELKREGKTIRCTVCSNSIGYQDSTVVSRIKDHVSSARHKKQSEKGGYQTSLIEATQNIQTQKDFNHRLTLALTAANIHLEKLINPTFKDFLEKETKRAIPHPSTLRKNYVPVLANEIIAMIRERIGNSNVYFIIDETQDFKTRFVVNTMVGILNGQKHDCYLLNVEFVERTDNNSIQKAVLNACKILWPDQIEFKRLHLIISDQAGYMLLAVKKLKEMEVIFPHINHITCLAHAFHRVSELIQSENSVINQFLTDCKKFLLKSAKRKSDFKTATDLTLPPVPINTRWGTWLSAAAFYLENYEAVKNFIIEYQPDSDSAAFERLKKLATGPNQSVAKCLFKIKPLMEIPSLITKLETRNLSVDEQLSIISRMKVVIKDHPSLEYKLSESLRKNPDIDSFPSPTDPILKSERKYCPLVSVDVERSFSKFNYLFDTKRNQLTLENIKYLMIIHYNSFLYWFESNGYQTISSLIRNGITNDFSCFNKRKISSVLMITACWTICRDMKMEMMILRLFALEPILTGTSFSGCQHS